MADVFAQQRIDNPLAFGTRLTEHTPADSDLPGGVKVVMFDADGTVDIKNPDGTAITGVPVKAMAPLAFIPARVTAMATATKCYLVR
jgi:hypothetical protein